MAVPAELVEFLRAKHPLRPPDLCDSEREIFFQVGIQSMIDYLDTLRKRQERAALKNRQQPDQTGHT